MTASHCLIAVNRKSDKCQMSLHRCCFIKWCVNGEQAAAVGGTVVSGGKLASVKTGTHVARAMGKHEVCFRSNATFVGMRRSACLSSRCSVSLLLKGLKVKL